MIRISHSFLYATLAALPYVPMGHIEHAHSAAYAALAIVALFHQEHVLRTKR